MVLKFLIRAVSFWRASPLREIGDGGGNGRNRLTIFFYKNAQSLKLILTAGRIAIRFRWPSEAVAPDTTSRPACWCRSALFGSDRRAGRGCGTSAALCSTCCPRREPESACCVPAPSVTPKSRRTKSKEVKGRRWDGSGANLRSSRSRG